MVQIPVDQIELNVGRKRETRIYYRPHTNPDGEVVEIQTRRLPADPWHLNYYAKKGFKLWPQGKEPGQEELTLVQEKVASLKAQAAAIKEATAEGEDAKAELVAEVKVLEEQATNLRGAIGEVKLDSSKGKISCPEPDCSVTVKSYIGLSRHMRSKHGIK